MINVSGHLRNERRVTGFADDSVSLSVNCCGMQVFKTKDYSKTTLQYLTITYLFRLNIYILMLYSCYN